MAKIFWIDDNVTTTDLVGEKLERLGHSVTVRNSITGKIPALSKFDLVVVDLFMERIEKNQRHTEFGLDYLMQWLTGDRNFRASVENGETRCLLLSQHLAEYELREMIKDFTEHSDIRAFLRSKNRSAEQYPSRMEAIAAIIADVAVSVEDPRLSDEVDRLLRPSSDHDDFFAVSLADFRSMPEPMQAELQEQALEASEAVVESFFEEASSADWAILSGQEGIVASGPSGALPSAIERRAMAEERGQPLVVVTRRQLPASSPGSSKLVEELRFRRRRQAVEPPTRCEGVMHDYPVLHLELANLARTYHFDTGCDTNYLRASVVREHGTVLYVEDRVRESSRHGKYYVYDLPPEGVVCQLVDKSSGESFAVRIEGYAIEQFKNWEYARRCHDNSCGYAPLGEICLVRFGLIGRGFLGDNDLVLELDPSAEHAAFRRTD